MARETWANVFSAVLHHAALSPETIAQIYQLEMQARTFFEWEGIVPTFLVLQNIGREDGYCLYHWVSQSETATCPQCETVSQMPAREYVEQPWQDLPYGGRAVWHRVQRRIYRCLNPACPQGDFVERLGGLADVRARKTLRFQRYGVARALDGGCKPAEDVLKRDRAAVSNDTIARYVGVCVATVPKTGISLKPLLYNGFNMDRESLMVRILQRVFHEKRCHEHGSITGYNRVSKRTSSYSGFWLQ